MKTAQHNPQSSPPRRGRRIADPAPLGLAGSPSPPSCYPRHRPLDDATRPAPPSSATRSLTAALPSCWPACGNSATGTCSVRPRSPPTAPSGSASASGCCSLPRTHLTATGHDLAWILLAFAIFNTYMLLMSSQVNAAVFGVFLTLEITEIVLVAGDFLWQRRRHQGRRLRRRPHRPGRLVHLRSGHIQRAGRPDPDPGRAAVALSCLIAVHPPRFGNTRTSPPVRTCTVQPGSRFGQVQREDWLNAGAWRAAN